MLGPFISFDILTHIHYLISLPVKPIFSLAFYMGLSFLSVPNSNVYMRNLMNNEICKLKYVLYISMYAEMHYIMNFERVNLLSSFNNCHFMEDPVFSILSLTCSPSPTPIILKELPAGYYSKGLDH